MAKFVFELEAVLKQRLAVEREKQLAVAAMEQERSRFEDVIRGHQRELTREKEELRDQLISQRPRQETGDSDGHPTDAGGTYLDLRGVRFQAGAALRLVTLAQRAVLQLAGVHKKIDVARLSLLEATTRRKAVEVLKDRRLEEWKAEQKRRENAAADELSVMLAARAEETV